MKGYRVKKITYSITAVIMVLVLSLPTVARASSGARITTYECVKDIYTQGSWQDMVIEQTYCMSNDLYSYYEGGFVDMPFSLSDYNYYAIMKNSSIVMVLGFNVTGSVYACASSGDIYTNLLKENRNESYIFSILEQGYNGFIKDNGMDLYNYGSGVKFCFEGSWDRWDYDVASGIWFQSVNDSLIDSRNEQECVSASSYSLLDTNCPLYSEYEFAVITCGNESQHSMSELGFDSSRYEYILSMLPSMTQLNQNLKYYDGENIVGGAPSWDNSLGFSSCTVEKINHPDALGGSGAYITWQMLPNTLERLTPDWKVRMNYTVNYTIKQVNDGVFSDTTNVEYNLFYDTVDYDIESFVKQNGSCNYFLNEPFEKGIVPGSLYLFLDYFGAEGFSNAGGSFENSFAGESLKAFIEQSLSGMGIPFVLNDDDYYGFSDLFISVEIQLYNESSNTYSNSTGGSVNLITGQNSTWCNEVSEDNSGQNINPDKNTSGNNYYNVVTETDSNGNTYQNYYYYDTTNNTVTPSINTSGTLNLVHTFANSLNITGISSGGSGGSGGSSSSLVGSGDGVDITIEDDDYTDAALREDLRDGFGLLDNMNTDESSDGFLQLSAKFYEHLDGDLDDMLVFGMSSVIVIAILRMALRR